MREVKIHNVIVTVSICVFILVLGISVMVGNYAFNLSN